MTGPDLGESMRAPASPSSGRRRTPQATHSVPQIRVRSTSRMRSRLTYETASSIGGPVGMLQMLIDRLGIDRWFIRNRQMEYRPQARMRWATLLADGRYRKAPRGLFSYIPKIR